MSAPVGERVGAVLTASLAAAGFAVLDVLACEDAALVDFDSPFVRVEFADDRGGAHGAKALYGGRLRYDPLVVWSSWVSPAADPYPVALPSDLGAIAALSAVGLGSTIGVRNDDVRLVVAAASSPALRDLVAPGGPTDSHPGVRRRRVDRALGDEDGDATEVSRALFDVLRFGEVTPSDFELARPALELAVTGVPLEWLRRRLGLGGRA